MSEIDWSKAPDWADSVWLGALTSRAYWVHTGAERSQRIDDGFAAAVFDAQCWTKVCDRPAAPWNGQGLPPIGAVCELRQPNTTDWEKATIKLHDGGECVWRSESGSLRAGMIHHLAFRPIRAPEQIAAEDRNKACNEMLEIAQSRRRDPDVYEAIATLYDAGYRKQEPKP